MPSVEGMTFDPSHAGLAYDDPATPSELTADCRAAEARLAFPAPFTAPLSAPFSAMARAAARPAPSIRFEDFPREVAKRDVDPAVAARRIAAALDLDL